MHLMCIYACVYIYIYMQITLYREKYADTKTHNYEILQHTAAAHHSPTGPALAFFVTSGGLI